MSDIPDQSAGSGFSGAGPENRVIVGVSGASGAIFGVRLLELLRDLKIQSHLIVSKAAAVTLTAETGLALSDLERLAFKRYPAGDIGAAIASGSFRTRGMIIAPCSIKTMSEIATGATTTLLSRAADVVLKERRRLVLAVRESPLHLGHLRSLTALAEMGAVIAPPAPAFYAGPESIDDMVTQTAARLLDLVGLDSPAIRRWRGAGEPDQD